jgi:3-dehydrosphinganine reductase
MHIVITLAAAILVLAILLDISRRFFARRLNFSGKTVVITGGSSGVGLALAQESLSRGAATVFLIARTQSTLDSAVNSLQFSSAQRVLSISADVSDWSSVEAAVSEISKSCQSVDYLFANAGYADPRLFEELTADQFRNQMNVNFLGAAFVTRLLLPLLRRGSHVVFSASVCSVLSFAGYGAYGPAKYAVRGLAETLRNELKSFGIETHIGILSTVDTPGLKRENEVKPKVCSAIEGTATVFSAKEVAQKIIRGLDRGDYVIVMEPLAWIMVELNCGIIPSNNIFASLLVAPFLPIIRWVAVLYIDFLAKKHPKSE